jgi:zinc protease
MTRAPRNDCSRPPIPPLPGRRGHARAGGVPGALAALAALAALIVACVPLAPAAAAAPPPAAPPGTPSKEASPGMATVTLPSSGSPLVAIRLRFDAGSIDDPAGKEGLAALTALMIGDAGTAKRSYSQLLDALYPLAASFGHNTDREVTELTGTVHRDALDAFTALLEEALLSPGFAESDFQRNREQLLSYLTNVLRSGSDELLGLEAIQDAIFAGHPYGHPAEGTVSGLASITLDDVRRFYKEHYTRARLTIGLAGGYPEAYLARLERDLAALGAQPGRDPASPDQTAAPSAQPGRPPLPPPPPLTGRRFTLIEKETGSVGIHFGFPLPVSRSSPDNYPLLVANSALGEHRTFTGRLMSELRQSRGLNYGDYSYIEYWANPPGTTHPTPGVPRRQQYFSVWIRPVVPGDAQFALRAALYQVQRLAEEGIAEQEFAATRDFLLNYTKLWAQDLQSRLGFLIDSRFYGTPYVIDEIDARLRKLTLAEVNQAIKKYLAPGAFAAVLVTAKAAELRELLQKDSPSPKKYNAQVAPAVLEADRTIESLPLRPTAIEIVPAVRMFEK